MRNVNLNDLQCFLAVADSGTLSEAARRLDMSVATLGRRMVQLEETVGRKLFVRQQYGYALTQEGLDFRDRLRPFGAAYADFARWLADDTQRPEVRLSAGTWTANFLAEHFVELCSPEDAFDLVFVATEARLNLKQREIDIGLRNGQPTESNLAARRLVKVTFAPFRSRSLVGIGTERWVGLTRDTAVTPSSRWVLDHHGADIVAHANGPRALFDLVNAGIGITVLPCFAGDRHPQLERAGDVIEELTEFQWLVMHADGRHRPAVRKVADRIVDLIGRHKTLYSGELPSR
ncbi:LysR family transcriptional regulator [Qingshengfaniella alkalisoli]|uniref:LysR family transcriptional regulator n=1 Tax=Qingshengfaniella alkalisoli TaxID=2599296 RepID=A0A5B8I823_9RHOB|nr:LysR family transcriptional regulator [Qingshengfaniella alkalisoli]QDY70055.1 LysR family transcriptional regulator [Qingshengfaniella alkalisoli]